MNNVLAAAARSGLRLLVFQIACVLVIAGGVAVGWGVRVGCGVAIGGAIGLLGTIYLVMVLFKHSFDHGVRLGAGSFLVGWAIKAVLTIALLFIALRSGSFPPLALIGGLALSLAAYWVHVTFFQVKHADTVDGK